MTKVIDKVALLLVRDRKVLFARSKKEQLLFYTVGGKREPGESDHEALSREVREEIGAELVPGSVRFYRVFEGRSEVVPADTVLKMTCYFGKIDREPVPTSEIAELAWFDTFEHCTTTMGRRILDQLSWDGYIK